MYLSKVIIKNYRLLIDAELEVDPKTTLIVGRNNTAKTSSLICISKALSGSVFSFDDYPLSKRENIYSDIELFMKREISFEELFERLEPISVDFFIDYSLEDSEDSLGALAPFIIDIDVKTTVAQIGVEFRLRHQEESIWRLLKPYYYNNDVFTPPDDAYNLLKKKFNRLFELSIYAINPNNKKQRQKKTIGELANLFPYQPVPAERRLGEDGTQDESLSDLISNFFDMNEEDLDKGVVDKVRQLKDIIEKSGKAIQIDSDRILSELVHDAICFGYPNGEELQLGVTTTLSIDDQIKRKTQLSYTGKDDEERLPSTYNGLGYKNLIKIEFILASFAKIIEQKGDACIPLLFIEEPESHMHPQMQQLFTKYLEEFLSKRAQVDIQVIMTSHSAHIASTIPFSEIRYAHKSKDNVKYRNLNKFAQDNSVNVDFIKKYLTLTKCDLFFADKAILIEGASERLLLPDMIGKCSKSGDFNSQAYELPNQYYTLIEVGGAFAYKFIPFINFLGIPCLVLTDLDSVSGKNHISALVSGGDTTSNETIKQWFRMVNKLPSNAEVPLKDIMSMSPADKTLNKCHIEFQTTENGLCGRSMEEAIINVNRAHFGLSDSPAECDIEFSGKSKTDFALNLIFECSDYAVPAYIRNGLIWLNNQLACG